MTDPVFTACMAVTLPHEGGYKAASADDPGGETNRGISRRAYPNEDIVGMTDERAAFLYFRDYFTPAKLALLPVRSAVVTVKVFDIGVDVGMEHSVTCLQRALRSLGRKVDEDGLVGNQVAGAVHAVDVAPLLAAVKSELAGYYRLVAQAKPEERPNLKGWLNRPYS